MGWMVITTHCSNRVRKEVCLSPPASITPIDKDVDCISKTCYLFSRTARRVWFANQRFLRCLVAYTSTNSTTMANDPKSVDDYHYHRQVRGNHDEAIRYWNMEDSKVSGKVIVLQESSSGESTRFRDIQTGMKMTRAEFVREIEKGKYPNYHIRIVDGLKMPVLNRDFSKLLWSGHITIFIML